MRLPRLIVFRVPLENHAAGSDKVVVSAFLEDAGAILEAARCATGAMADPANLTILIGPEGGIHMLTDSDWPLASLEAHHGARTIYRIHHTDGRIVVEGRCGVHRCHLEHSPAPHYSGYASPDLATRMR